MSDHPPPAPRAPWHSHIIRTLEPMPEHRPLDLRFMAIDDDEDFPSVVEIVPVVVADGAVYLEISSGLDDPDAWKVLNRTGAEKLIQYLQQRVAQWPTEADVAAYLALPHDKTLWGGA